MTKTSKRILKIGGGLLALLVVLPVALTPLVHMRLASVKPLDRQELARLGIAVPDGERSSFSATESQDAALPHASRDTSGSLPVEAPADSAAPLLLAGPVSQADRVRHLRTTETWDHLLTWGYLGALKPAESLVWLVSPESARGFEVEIGREAFVNGDVETARNYLREALRKETGDWSRAWICSMLAWLEDDPEVATALLRESCLGGNGRDRYRLMEALDLCILTRSDALAEHYFGRWSEVVGKEEAADFLRRSSPNRDMAAWDAWKKRRAGGTE